jgi:RimJ/RimL family protein N-acetyltransferase
MRRDAERDGRIREESVSSQGSTPSPATVRLRAVRADDLPIFFAHQADPEAARMAAFPPRERDAFMAHWTKILADESVTTRTILVGGRVAGNLVCFEQEGEREVGYWIDRTHWGKGVATAALARFLEQVTERPLFARVAEHNAGSIRVLEKNGFARAGRETVVDCAGEVVEVTMKLA